MNQDITIVIADARRVTTLRHGLELPGRVLCLSTGNLPSAFESIRGQRPKVVIVDELFSTTPEGRTFIERVKRLSISQSEIYRVELVKGAWTVLPLTPDASIPAGSVQTDLNTRRAPRFPVAEPRPALVEGCATTLVDMSILGAQVISEPVLRPNQRIRVALPDGEESLRLNAHIAWSLYEKPKHAQDPRYRAGMEFDNATAQVLEDFCRRHCLEYGLSYAPRSSSPSD